MSLSEICQKRVGAALPPDGGLRSVSWQDPDVVIEIENPVPHRIHQLVMRPARQVGPADRPCEELVTGKQHAFAKQFEAHVPRRVPRRVTHTYAKSCEVENLTVGKGIAIDGNSVLARRHHPEKGPELVVGPEGQEVIIGVNPAGDSEVSRNRPCPARMVDMTVCEQNPDRDQLVTLE